MGSFGKDCPCHWVLTHLPLQNAASCRDVSEERSEGEEEGRIVWRAQRMVLEVLEDRLNKNWDPIQKVQAMLVLAGEGREG